MSTARTERYTFVDEWRSLWKPDLEAIGYNGNTVDPTKVDSKVLQWTKDNCAHKPHFVKIINRTAAHGLPRPNSSSNIFYMSVPNLFVQENFKELGRIVTLENGDGRTWRVSFGTTPRGGPRWQQGWKRVAKDNNLNPMVCVLVGKSRFHFKVFDQDGNITTKGSTSTMNDISVKQEPSSASHGHQEPASISTPDQKPPKTSRKRLLEPQEPCGIHCSRNSHQSSPVPTVLHKTNPAFESVDPFAFSIKSRRRAITELECQKAWEAAMAHAKTLSGLHFIAVMSETQVYRDFHLGLPDCFVAESSFPTEAARWRLLDCDGNSWDMYSMTNKRNKVTLHRKHWAQFSLHHFLEDGDVCVFELTEDDSLAIVVHIVRVLPISTADKYSVQAHYDMREIDAA